MRMEDENGLNSTRSILQRFKIAAREAEENLVNENYSQAMAQFYDASRSADEMTERFLILLMRTAPSDAHRTLIVEFLSWRLRYFAAQYDYHLSVAQTLSGLPREEWIARLETILVLSQSLVSKLLPVLDETDDANVEFRIRELLTDWVQGIRELVSKLQSWGMASAQAAQVLEWALDNGIDAKTK
ncbi:MAG: hypothetical protein ACFFEF_00830 [Candidatus Thorarchaeota archaeon]